MLIQPKPFLDRFKLRHHAHGVERRRNMSKLILENGTEFPKPLTYSDIDTAVQKWVEDLNIAYEGKKLPTYRLYSNQRVNEYSQSWQNLDESGNLITSFKTVTRENNPKQGKINGESFNIPGDRRYPMFIRPTLQENGSIAYDMYSMRQPMAVDFNFTVGIICVKYELINEFNQMILNKFKSIECYIFPNEHPISMKLEEISDDSEYDINNRKYYSQAFKITVKAYVVDEADYKVTRLPSRLIMRTEGVNPPKSSIEKFELDTIDTSLSALTHSDGECLPYEDDMLAKVHDYGDSVSIGEEYVAPEDCIRPDDNHYYYKIVTIIVGLDCKDCNTFTLDTDVVIQEIQLENVYDFVVTANKEKMDFSGDTTFYAGDEIGVCITREEEGEPSVVTFVGYDPNVVFDDRNNPESSLDEIPNEEVIEVV